MLAERFPNCFTSGGSPRPLKIGIHEDLMAAGLEFSKAELRRAIGHYCSPPATPIVRPLLREATASILTATRAALWLKPK
jgi:hypothetical protein